jgi:glycine cleavage system H protein
MSINPKDRLYTDEHEWIQIINNDGLIGITHNAQHCLGDVVYVEMPKVGSSITKGQSIGVVESVKAVSDIYAPVSGIVLAINEKVISSPEMINQDPFGQGWLLKVSLNNLMEVEQLLSVAQYDDLLAREAKHA